MSSHNAVQGNGVYKLQAQDRAFAVLDLLAASNTPLGLADRVKGIQQDLGYTTLSRS